MGSPHYSTNHLSHEAFRFFLWLPPPLPFPRTTVLGACLMCMTQLPPNPTSMRKFPLKNMSMLAVFRPLAREEQLPLPSSKPLQSSNSLLNKLLHRDLLLNNSNLYLSNSSLFLSNSNLFLSNSNLLLSSNLLPSPLGSTELAAITKEREFLAQLSDNCSSPLISISSLFLNSSDLLLNSSSLFLNSSNLFLNSSNLFLSRLLPSSKPLSQGPVLTTWELVCLAEVSLISFMNYGRC